MLYSQTISRLLEYFGSDTHLRDITAKKAAVFLAEQKNRTKGRKGKELSEWSREQIKTHCKTIFDTAVQWILIPTNPFKLLRSKKLATRRWHRVTVQEYRALLEVAPTLRWKAFYALAYTSGARKAELFSLTWNDIDFENGRLIIANREGKADMPPFYIKDCEARRIPLPPHTIDLLTQLQSRVSERIPYVLLDRERYERVKAKWQQLRKTGNPWENRYMDNNVLRDFKGHLKRAGIKPVGKLTIHTLRKSCGQNWADYLPMNVVKELMGHSDIATTAEFYNQVDADHEAKAASVFQRLIDDADARANSKKTDVRMTPEAISHRNGGDK